MVYNFDEVIDRKQTDSVKWDEREVRFGSQNVLPMWVADMDFVAPAEVQEAMKKRAEHGIYGYTTRSDGYYEAMIQWFEKRHQWTIDRSWVTFSPGIVPALSMLVRQFTEPGDRIVIQNPVYYPFSNMIQRNGRQVVLNPLHFDGERYTMDYEDLEQKFQSGAKMVILSNPHNPVGRVWTKEELIQFGELCVRYDVLVVSDEIHGDLTYAGHPYTPFAAVSDDFAELAVTCVAPSKTFNIAGLQTSNIIIKNPALRQAYESIVEDSALLLSNTFGVVAAKTAYLHGEDWLNQVLAYIEGNLAYLMNYVRGHIPRIRVIQPEGTYLVWLDCRGLNLDDEALNRFMIDEANLALDEGTIFGQGGEGFMRINIATPRPTLVQALSQLERAVSRLATRA